MTERAPAERHPCDCDFYAGGQHATQGTWARWRYWDRGGWGRRALPLPWARGWMCVRCQTATPRDGDGKPLDVQVVYLKRRPARRFLRPSMRRDEHGSPIGMRPSKEPAP